MLAAVLKGKEDIKVEDVPDFEPRKNEVRIRVEHNGICGSDIHAYASGAAFTTVHRNNIMGHEFGGIIDTVGEGVTNFKAGDRVTAITAGAYAQYVPSDVSFVYKLPDDMGTDLASLIEPTAVALRGVLRSEIARGMTASVVGGGPIGLLALMILKSRGIDTVFLSEPGENRRQIGKKLGAIDAVEPNKLTRACQSATKGMGVDVAFECVGTTEALNSALASARRGGKVIVLGVYTKPYQMDMLSFLIREVSLIPSFGYQEEFADAIELLSRGEVPVMGVVTSNVKLDDTPKAFSRLLHEPDFDAKILVEPWA